MHHRWLAIVVVTLALGCFEQPPEVTHDSDAPPTCDQGEVGLPGVPEGWEGWAFIAVGGSGTRPQTCAEGMTTSVLFADASGTPECACVCGDDICNPTFSVGASCDAGVEMQGQLVGCESISDPATVIDISTNPNIDQKECAAVPVPTPGPSAKPVTVCGLAGNTDECVSVPEGFVGPCITGDHAECPAGFVEQASPAIRLSCEACGACMIPPALCDALTFGLFETADCSGVPVGTASAPPNCAPVDAFLSVQARPFAPTDADCAPTGASTTSTRICCLEP